MADDFKYDVFLSHSAKDKEVVRPLAERLRANGLHVWFDEWEIHPGDSIPTKIDEGLEYSRVLVFCMSAHAFGSDWAILEGQTFRFRDPLNKERRFIPLRLDEAPLKGSLIQFHYINWHSGDHGQEFEKLCEACLPLDKMLAAVGEAENRQTAERAIQLAYKGGLILAYAFDQDRTRLLTNGRGNSIRLWNVETGRYLYVFDGHSGQVKNLAWSPDQGQFLSCSEDMTVRLWDMATRRCLRILTGHTATVWAAAWSTDQRRALSCSEDRTVRLWDLERGICLRIFGGHTARIVAVAWSTDQRRALTASLDNSMRLWDVETGSCLHTFKGHTSGVLSVEWSADQRFVISGSRDNTLRLWDVETGRCLRVLEGHTSEIGSVAWSADQRYALSGSKDTTLRLWDMETGRCLRVLEGHKGSISCVVWSTDQARAFSGDQRSVVQFWDLSAFATTTRVQEGPLDQVQYTNAKVLLVGESGSGKTGLSMRLALNDWQPSASTVGAWATQWKLPVSSDEGIEREIWLWDFGGQADQRLIHQLYMDEAALAVLVFDGQQENLFEALTQWDRDLTRASRKEFSKLLVAGRVDVCPLRTVSRGQVEVFAKDRGFSGFIETSAMDNRGCEELRQAILAGIRWEEIPWRSSPLLFRRLREEIIQLKDEGKALMRFNELREVLILRLSGEEARFSDDELKAVLSLLAGPGVVWELKFGSWVLLQPERINAYAQAVIQTLRIDEQERGSLPEDQVLKGDLTYPSSIVRMKSDEERFVLLAMHQMLVEQGICLREHTDKGALLIFPSYYRRERPELIKHPAVLVSYRFNGFLDEIYATLVVRLHHTVSFSQDKLWRYAADFKTLTGKQVGVKLTRRAEGAGELEVYFDQAVEVGEKIIFSKYVHMHLLQNARDVVRLRHYVCPYCFTMVGNREVAMERLNAWLEQQPVNTGLAGRFRAWAAKAPTIICARCERRVPLWDQLEQSFASSEIQQHVIDLQERVEVVLETESRNRALVGEVISTVALAGQISREFNVNEHGIDMEIEFKSDEGEATGCKLYLQLKFSDFYLRQRKKDGTEIFSIKDEDHAHYWMSQRFPVLLVIRNSREEAEWMDVRSYLINEKRRRKEERRKREKIERRRGQSGPAPAEEPMNEIVFVGERFDVMSVRRWRDRVLANRV